MRPSVRDPSQSKGVAIESRALVVAAVTFALAGGPSLFYFLANDNAISGRGSVGEVAAITATGAGAIGFGIAYTVYFIIPLARRTKRRQTAVELFDMIALALAHATVLLLLWTVAFYVVQQAFDGAVLHPVAAALMTGAASAVSGYFAFLSGASMTTSRLSVLLLVFLVGGVLTSMLTAGDPRWWEKNISALGITQDLSGIAFNYTLAIAGVVVTALAGYGTRDLQTAPVAREGMTHGVRTVRWSLTTIGVSLAAVGLFPSNQNIVVHNSAATGMVVTFAALVIALPWLFPCFPRAFLSLGYSFLVAIVIAVVLWTPVGYYGLTAVELITSSLIFVWLVVFTRTLAASEMDGHHQSDAPIAPATAGDVGGTAHLG